MFILHVCYLPHFAQVLTDFLVAAAVNRFVRLSNTDPGAGDVQVILFIEQFLVRLGLVSQVWFVAHLLCNTWECGHAGGIASD